ncbi:hypothetical protein [Henriciella sp.]|uniref:hypothetical protein n=1 Tax=Henriciella sp. TaxID=1968823 RepID=UPI002620E113|nr:hypothetical protein [Henriciella sp.]
MNFEKIKKHLNAQDKDPRFIKHIEPALRAMHEEGVDPYSMGLAFACLSTTVVQVGLPNQELGGFGRYMQNLGKAVEKHSEFCEELIQSTVLAPPPDEEDLADYDAPPYRW